jgi:rfaE bifunctional protein nucleotidyltransferase chain/domain
MFETATKIALLPDAILRADAVRDTGKRIVFTNGCFDLLHLGHVDYLEKARNLGDFLVVGINTDASVSSLKGPSRPVSPEASRMRVLAALAFVDLVVPFGEPTPIGLIESLKPDILTKGNDYSLETIVGADFVMGYGGKVETIPLVEGFSTTNFVNRIMLNP